MLGLLFFAVLLFWGPHFFFFFKNSASVIAVLFLPLPFGFFENSTLRFFFLGPEERASRPMILTPQSAVYEAPVRRGNSPLFVVISEIARVLIRRFLPFMSCDLSILTLFQPGVRRSFRIRRG